MILIVREYTFENTNCSSLNINSSFTTALRSEGSTISSITTNFTSPTMEQRLLTLNGDFKYSPIIITSSTIIQLDESFTSNSPLTISTTEFCNVTFVGDLSKIPEVIVTGPCELFEDNFGATSFPQITIAIPPEITNTKVDLNGNFNNTFVKLNSSSDLTLNGAFNSIDISDTTLAVKLTLSPSFDLTGQSNIKTSVKVTADLDALSKLENSLPAEQHPNVILVKQSFLVDFVDGIGKVNCRHTTPGSYRLKVYVNDGVNDIEIALPIVVTINQP